MIVAHGLGRMRKEIEALSLSPERPVMNALGRSPGLGFYLLAAPSHPSTGLRTVAGLRLSWPSQWRDRAGIAPDFPLNLEL
jgi:hypothetical protein